MSEKAKRRFWQFHLSTLLVATLLAGSAVWANLTPQSSPDRYGILTTWSQTGAKYYGWPVCAYVHWATDTIFNPDTDELVSNPPRWSLTGAIMSVLAFIIVATSCSILTEAIIRRREAHKT